MRIQCERTVGRSNLASPRSARARFLIGRSVAAFAPHSTTTTATARMTTTRTATTRTATTRMTTTRTTTTTRAVASNGARVARRDVRARAKDKKRKAARAQRQREFAKDLATSTPSEDAAREDEDAEAVGRSEGGTAARETAEMVFHALDLGLSYKKATGTKLVEGNVMVHDAARALFRAPFACASHDGNDVFNYGNQAALELWEMEWDAFVGMSSKKSADEADEATQAERRALLDRAASDGVIMNYSGVRVSSRGTKFRIEDATVWTMKDGDGNKTGQAVRFDRVVRLQPDGSDGEVRVVNDEGHWVTRVDEPMGEAPAVDAAKIEELSAAVDAKAAEVRALKDAGLTNADDDVKAAVKVLLDLKSQLSALTENA